ncbi:metallophosphoesterase [Planctomicrobium sp. SH668]|uniref:metallophosphoesterase n=1 Tax=Planctomicrobium sp. SH668 TaxID=3448126 RepID=UPI003F5B5555
MEKLNRRCFLQSGMMVAAIPAMTLLSQPLKAEDASNELTKGAPPPPAAGGFTMLVLPDTQNYSSHFPQTFAAQTQWAVDNQESRSLACVLHLGDVTNNNTAKEWENAVAAMNLLDGKIPYFMALGNHDYSQGGTCKDRTTLFHDYFPLAKYNNLPNFGGVYDKEPDRFDNSYHTLDVGARKFLIVSLEFGPRGDVIRWANEVVAKHSDHEAILITHAYMHFDESRYDWKTKGSKQAWNPHSYPIAKATDDDVNDGEELWNKLIEPNEQFILTLNGHVLGDGLGRFVSKHSGDKDVTQMLVNFQMKPNGGDGWLRLLNFEPDGKTINVYDYSPVLDLTNTSSQNRFTIQLS